MRAEHSSVSEYLKASLTSHQLESIGLLSFNQWSFAMGAMIDTALAAQQVGSKVVLGFWANDTPLPDTGWTSSRTYSRLLGSRTKDQRAEEGLRAMGLPHESFTKPPINHWRPEGMPGLPDPLTRAAVRELTYKSQPMGRAILQVHPDFKTPIREDHVWPKRWVQRSMRSYAWAFDQATALIKKHELTAVVVYNGRFTHDKAVSDAATATSIRVLYYDTGGYDTDFDLTTMTTHDWSHLQRRMNAMYSGWDPVERDAIGSAWFTNRQTHQDQSLQPFVDAQVIGHLEDLPEAEKLVVYFSSSGDEIAELEIDWSDYLESQEAALADLAAACRARPGTRLVVRTHPHMRLKPTDDLVQWTKAVDAAGPDLHIGPHSSVDSYTLMRAADVVFTYGSTAGLEAGFIGRPSVVMGPSAYDELGCAQRIRTASEIPAALENPPIPNSHATLPFGLMMQRRGFNYEYLQKRTSGEPTVGGIALDDPSVNAKKLSHLRLRLLTWWLTRR